MDIVDLTNKENELYSIVLEIHGTMEEKEKELRDKGIYDEYKQIHSSYADKADKDLESLKRGLFIQWYALAEPSCFTGINELDSNAEVKIIKQIDGLIDNDNLDSELNWILKFYSSWDYVFERFKRFNALQKWIKNGMGTELPNTINRDEMVKRGQMGKYWNSLIPFAE
jgi:hypothetical protein